MNLERIQEALRAEICDGWLFYDFRKSNPIAYQALELPLDEMYTRRWFYFVPADGTPVALVSARLRAPPMPRLRVLRTH